MGTAAAAAAVLGYWREPRVFPWMATRGQERDPRPRVNPVVAAQGRSWQPGGGGCAPESPEDSKDPHSNTLQLP